MKYDRDEDLERALFALPLEEPPRDLRAAILAGTIYRAPFPLRPWEIISLGVLCAFVVWLIISIAAGGGVALLQTVNNLAKDAARILSNPATLAWLAAGAATAVWLTLWTVPGNPIRTSARR